MIWVFPPSHFSKGLDLDLDFDFDFNTDTDADALLILNIYIPYITIFNSILYSDKLVNIKS